MLDKSVQYEYRLEAPNLVDYQKEFLYCRSRFTVVEACPKSGKTFSHLWWIAEIAHGLNPQWYTNNVRAGMEFWWVAPIDDTAELAFNRLVAIFRGKEGYKIHVSKMYIITPLGTIIRFKSAAKPDNLYGEDVYAAVFDEFTRSKKSSWLALRSTLTSTKGPCKFIGNFTGSKNWGHKLGKKANEPNSSYSYFKIDIYQAVAAGIIDADEVEQIREDYPPQIFNVLYLVKGGSSNNVLFSEEMLSNVFTNNFIEEGRERYITADIALHGSDKFVICLWHGWVLKLVQSIDKCDADEVTAFLKEASRLWRVPLTNIVYDADGSGSFLRGYLRQAKPFNNGGSPIQSKKDKRNKIKINYENLKTQCFFLLSHKMSSNLLFFEHQEYQDLIEEELEVIEKYQLEDDKKLRITPKKEVKQILGRSPDYAEAIMMRLYFDLKSTEATTRFVNPQKYLNTRNQ